MKKVLIVSLVFILVLGLTGCGKSNKFVGTWRSLYSTGGEQGYVYLELKNNGTYVETKYLNGSVVSEIEGKYEYTDDTVTCYKSEKSWTEYKYRADKLVNGSTYYTRYDETDKTNNNIMVEEQ